MADVNDGPEKVEEKPEQPVRPATIWQPEDNSALEAKAESKITQAWIAATVFGIIVLLSMLYGVTGSWLLDNAVERSINIAVVFVLAYGIFRRDKTSAILMLINAVYSIGMATYRWSQNGELILFIFPVIFVLLSIQGVRGTFAYHSIRGSDGYSSPILTILRSLLIACVFSVLYVVLVYGKHFNILPFDLSSYLSRAHTFKSSDWKVFTSPEGQFSVDLPGSPRPNTLVKDVSGVKISLYQFGVESIGQNGFLAQYNEIPEIILGQPNLAEGLLTGSRNGLVNQIKGGRLVSEKSLYLNKFPGKEMVAENDEQTVRARVFVIEPRIYMMIVAAPKGQAFTSDANRFIDSFKLIMDGPQVISDHPSTGIAIAGQWVIFSPTDGRFNVELPGAPSAAQETVQTSAGPMVVHRYNYTNNEIKHKFSLQYADYPEKLLQKMTNAETVLRNASEGDVDRIKGTLVSEKPLKMDRYTGREVRIDNADISIKVKLFLVDKRLYKIITEKPKSLMFSADDDRFLSSFQVSGLQQKSTIPASFEKRTFNGSAPCCFF